MGVKLIAIGNRLMGDEGIAIKVAEKLDKELKSEGIDVIIGETDVDFCFNCIDDNDYLIILDATCYGVEPGAISITPLKGYRSYLNHSFTQHDLSLLRTLYNLGLNISGYLIGIEIGYINFDLNLSSMLSKKIDLLCNKLKKIINVLISKPDISDFSLLFD